MFSWKFETEYGTFQLTIPRDHNRDFSPTLIPTYGGLVIAWKRWLLNFIKLV